MVPEYIPLECLKLGFGEAVPYYVHQTLCR